VKNQAAHNRAEHGCRPGQKRAANYTSCRQALKEDAARDFQLVQRCVQGEVAAWEELYAQCHQPLCAVIRRRLGRSFADPNLVDELAARVWYAVVANDGELLAKYRPDRGARILTFLCSIARHKMVHYLRCECRRLARDLASARQRRFAAVSYPEPACASLTDFLATLTPHERRFCTDHLLAGGTPTAPTAEKTYSRSNIWQLTHRVYEKLLTFFDRR